MRRENAGRYECDCDITDYPEKREREGGIAKRKRTRKGSREGEREKFKERLPKLQFIYYKPLTNLVYRFLHNIIYLAIAIIMSQEHI